MKATPLHNILFSLLFSVATLAACQEAEPPRRGANPATPAPPEATGDAVAVNDDATATTAVIGDAAATAPTPQTIPAAGTAPPSVSWSRVSVAVEPDAPQRVILQLDPLINESLGSSIPPLLGPLEESFSAMVQETSFNPVTDIEGVLLTSQAVDVDALGVSDPLIVISLRRGINAPMLMALRAATSTLEGAPALIVLGAFDSEPRAAFISALTEATREDLAGDQTQLTQVASAHALGALVWPGGAILTRGPDEVTASAAMTRARRALESAASAPDAGAAAPGRFLSLRGILRGAPVTIDVDLGENFRCGQPSRTAA